MARKRNNIFNLVKICMIVPSMLSFMGSFVSLLEEDAKLAGKSIATIIALCLMAGCILTSTWLCVLGMVYVGLMMIPMPPILALSIIFLLNLLLLLIIYRIMANMKNKLSFPETRRVIRSIKNNF